MKMKILKDNGSLGKITYEGTAPANMYLLRRKLKKTIIGVGTWRNRKEVYIAILPEDKNIVFLSETTIKEIQRFIKRVKR